MAQTTTKQTVLYSVEHWKPLTVLWWPTDPFRM